MDVFENIEKFEPKIKKFLSQCVGTLFVHVKQEVIEQIFNIFYDVIDSLLPDYKDDTDSHPVVEELDKEFAFDLDNLADLELAMRHFDEYTESREKFMINFPKWKKLRLNTMKKLGEIADEMNKDRLNCNVTRVTGSSVGLVSGIGVLASVLVPPLAPVAYTVAVGSGVVGVSGAAVSITGDILEKVWIDKLNETAKIEVSEDKKSFEELMEYFKHTELLKSELEKIINFKGLSEILKEKLKPFCLNLFKKVRQMMQRLEGLQSIFESELSIILGPLVQMLINEGIVTILKQNARYYIMIVIASYIAYDVLTFTMSFLVDENNRLSLALAGSSLAATIGKTVTATASVAVVETPSFLPKLYTQFKSLFQTEQVVPTVASSLGSKAAVSLSGIGMVIDLVNIYVNASDLQEGSISNHATKLQNLTEELNKELRCIKKVFDKMIPYSVDSEYEHYDQGTQSNEVFLTTCPYLHTVDIMSVSEQYVIYKKRLPHLKQKRKRLSIAEWLRNSR